ncbi:hypothetical protein H2202_009816 [Exophiala xenobiotica]|nr:hypothetical protein H2202_009816 [Exophiala xenobiotica]
MAAVTDRCRVNNVTVSSEHKTVHFSVAKTTLPQAFQGLHISIGRPHETSSHVNPGQRRNLPTYTSDITSTSSSPSETSTTIDLAATTLIPSTATTSSPSIDLSHKSSDLWFPDLDPNIPISLGCKDCHTTGSLSLTQGEWSLINSTDWAYVESITTLFKLDFCDLLSKTSSLIDSVTITDVPFQANVSDIELTLGLVLIPRITIGMEILSDFVFDLVASLNLPDMSVAITQLATDAVDASCESSNDTPFGQAEFEELYHNLTHISANVAFDAGLDMKASVRGLGLETEIGDSLASVTIATFPTQCLAFRTDVASGPAFTAATAAMAVVQASVSSATASQGGASPTAESGGSSYSGRLVR